MSVYLLVTTLSDKKVWQTHWFGVKLIACRQFVILSSWFVWFSVNPYMYRLHTFKTSTRPNTHAHTYALILIFVFCLHSNKNCVCAGCHFDLPMTFPQFYKWFDFLLFIFLFALGVYSSCLSLSFTLCVRVCALATENHTIYYMLSQKNSTGT